MVPSPEIRSAEAADFGRLEEIESAADTIFIVHFSVESWPTSPTWSSFPSFLSTASRVTDACWSRQQNPRHAGVGTGSSLAAAPYTYAATAPAGSRLIFLVGACPLHEDGATDFPGDYAAQAACCVETLTRTLAAAGASLTDVISTRVLVASSMRQDLVDAWDVVSAAFGDHDVPSTLLGAPCSGTLTSSSRSRRSPRLMLPESGARSTC